MAPTRKIRCVAVVVSVEDSFMDHDTNHTSPAPRFRPSDLVPWADPQIAGLVQKLQNEVRDERRQAKQPTPAPQSDADRLRADLGMDFEPSNSSDPFGADDWAMMTSSQE